MNQFISKINYTYIAVGLVIFLIIVALYIWRRNSLNSGVQLNAQPGDMKRTEGFDPEQESGSVKAEIVMYYAMWCGYSRSFLPEWEKFEIYAKEKFPNIKVTRLRCEEGNETACQQKGINGFPMVVLYPVGKPQIEFDKERNMQKLVEFVNENM